MNHDSFSSMLENKTLPWKNRPATRSKAKQTGRYEIDHYLVASGSITWTGAGPENADHKEDLVFMPLQIERTSALFLMAGLEICFGQSIGGIKSLVERSLGTFDLLQFLTVADAAAANVSVLAKFFSWLQEFHQKRCSSLPDQKPSLLLARFVPCLLHQLARILVLRLESQQLNSRMFCLTRPIQQTPLKKSLIRFLGFKKACFCVFLLFVFMCDAETAQII